MTLHSNIYRLVKYFMLITIKTIRIRNIAQPEYPRRGGSLIPKTYVSFFGRFRQNSTIRRRLYSSLLWKNSFLSFEAFECVNFGPIFFGYNVDSLATWGGDRHTPRGLNEISDLRVLSGEKYFSDMLYPSSITH